MIKLRSNPSVSPELPPAVQTAADRDLPASPHRAASREAWQRVIDYKLIEWEAEPSQLEDEGVLPPNRETIQQAIQVAEFFRDDGRPPPDSVVPDANAGIVFERREGDVSEVLHIWDDGTMEYKLAARSQ